jgi:hypothetical protein
LASSLPLPVDDAAYGGNSLLGIGLAPTGSMPTSAARMIAFQAGGNPNWNRSKRICEFRVVHCGNDFVTNLSMDPAPARDAGRDIGSRSWAFPLGARIALE